MDINIIENIAKTISEEIFPVNRSDENRAQTNNLYNSLLAENNTGSQNRLLELVSGIEKTDFVKCKSDLIKIIECIINDNDFFEKYKSHVTLAFYEYVHIITVITNELKLLSFRIFHTLQNNGVIEKFVEGERASISINLYTHENIKNATFPQNRASPNQASCSHQNRPFDVFARVVNSELNSNKKKSDSLSDNISPQTFNNAALGDNIYLDMPVLSPGIYPETVQIVSDRPVSAEKNMDGECLEDALNQLAELNRLAGSSTLASPTDAYLIFQNSPQNSPQNLALIETQNSQNSSNSQNSGSNKRKSDETCPTKKRKSASFDEIIEKNSTTDTSCLELISQNSLPIFDYMHDLESEDCNEDSITNTAQDSQSESINLTKENPTAKNHAAQYSSASSDSVDLEQENLKRSSQKNISNKKDKTKKSRSKKSRSSRCESLSEILNKEKFYTSKETKAFLGLTIKTHETISKVVDRGVHDKIAFFKDLKTNFEILKKTARFLEPVNIQIEKDVANFAQKQTLKYFTAYLSQFTENLEMVYEDYTSMGNVFNYTFNLHELNTKVLKNKRGRPPKVKNCSPLSGDSSGSDSDYEMAEKNDIMTNITDFNRFWHDYEVPYKFNPKNIRHNFIYAVAKSIKSQLHINYNLKFISDIMIEEYRKNILEYSQQTDLTPEDLKAELEDYFENANNNINCHWILPYILANAISTKIILIIAGKNNRYTSENVIPRSHLLKPTVLILYQYKKKGISIVQFKPILKRKNEITTSSDDDYDFAEETDSD